jgi:hypothetical protein
MPGPNRPPVLNKYSSNAFNISNARIPKIAAVGKRFSIRNGSIGDIKPMQKKYQKP